MTTSIIVSLLPLFFMLVGLVMLAVLWVALIRWLNAARQTQHIRTLEGLATFKERGYLSDEEFEERRRQFL